jgi:SPP1 gp7 family putative phage head morphogenesis protein
VPTKLEGKILSWKEAEALFISKMNYSPKAYYELEEFARQHGFTVSRVASYAMLLRVKDELDRIIESGGTLAEFRAWAQGSGMAWSRSYTELVYRMNVFGSYSQARYAQINRPEVARVFEIIYYDAVNDTRTREEHSAMSGSSWKREEFPVGWWPPNGFNCRCEVRAVTQRMEKSIGARRTTTPPKISGQPVLPDKGFQRNYLDRKSSLRVLNNRMRTYRHELGT